MAGPLDENEEKPLDPAVERVRRKLVRFIIINLSLLFAAVIIVIAAIVYRSATRDVPSAAVDVRVPTGEALEADVPVPAGARLVSHTTSGDRVSLDLELPDARRMILIYDIAERRVVARLAVTPQ